MAKLATLLATSTRVTPEMVEACVISEDYHVFPGTTVTVCALTLMNGFIVTGESGCADPAIFDEEIGRDMARLHAEEKIWPVLGLILKENFQE